MYSRNSYRITQLAIGVLLLAPLGCAQVDLISWAKGIPEADEKNPVFNIVCVWEPSEGRNVDGMPARGFAGQLFFFTRLSPTPVKVNGDVRIYVFDDQGTIEDQAKPIHQFDFLGDAWTAHLQDSTLGPSYNVFIPYTREGGWLTNCQLRLRLTTESGDVVYSETADVALPGPTRSSSQDVTSAAGTTAPHLVGQHLAAQMRPPVESIQFGAKLRHETIRPTVATAGAVPLSATRAPAMPAPAMPAQPAVAQPAPKRFRLAATEYASPVTYGVQQPASRPHNANAAGRFDGFGAVPGNWPQVGRPIIPAPNGGYPAAARPAMNQPPPYQHSQNQHPQYGAPAYQPVVYHVEANGHTATGQRGTVGNNMAAGHPLGHQAAVRHPLADALQ